MTPSGKTLWHSTSSDHSTRKIPLPRTKTQIKGPRLGEKLGRMGNSFGCTMPGSEGRGKRGSVPPEKIRKIMEPEEKVEEVTFTITISPEFFHKYKKDLEVFDVELGVNEEGEKEIKFLPRVNF